MAQRQDTSVPLFYCLMANSALMMAFTAKNQNNWEIKYSWPIVMKIKNKVDIKLESQILASPNLHFRSEE